MLDAASMQESQDRQGEASQAQMQHQENTRCVILQHALEPIGPADTSQIGLLTDCTAGNN